MNIINIITSLVRESWILLANVSPFLLIGFGIAGVFHSFIGEDFIKKHLGEGNFNSILKSVLLGIPLPVCSCGIIPIAASLKRLGASKSSILSFLYATPTTGVDSILATYAFLGPLFALFRPLASFVGGIIIGTSALAIEKKRAKVKNADVEKPAFKKNLRDALRYGFLFLPKEIGKGIIIGVFIGGAITIILPDKIFSTYVANPFLSYSLMIIISVPLYVCATGSIPIAAALIWKGLSPGAALTFLIAGPATNALTITFVLKDLGKKFTALYITGILITSIAFGLLFDLVWKLTGGQQNSILIGGGRYIPIYIKIITSIVFLGLLLVSNLKKDKPQEKVKNMQVKFKVPNISCTGCVYRIKDSISELNGIRDVVVNLQSKEVLVDSDLPPEEIEKAIREAGYTVEETEILDKQK